MSFSEQIEMPKHKMDFPYDTGRVAKMLHYPEVNGRNKLRQFLREYDVIDGDYPAEEYVDLRYFTLRISKNNRAIVIMVSTAGYIFIKKLVEEKIEEYKENMKLKKSNNENNN